MLEISASNFPSAFAGRAMVRTALLAGPVSVALCFADRAETEVATRSTVAQRAAASAAAALLGTTLSMVVRGFSGY
jgi:hypothetical protein